MAKLNKLVGVCKSAPKWETDVVMPDMSIVSQSSDNYKDWVLLFFYPLDFTFVCPTEIIEFSNKASEFKKIGCDILGCSVDSQFTHYAWMKTPRKEGGIGKINIPLLADVSRKISSDFGVLLDEGHTCRGTFIIDPKGIIRHMSFNDPPVGRNVDEYLRLVKAYQFTDKHGEVCPAKWKPGSKTIKPNPKGSLEYFSQS
mmetsp:Transcript_86873/g.106554  ORF Transcript_86873/g.106554 Transcript_86873/m.106554 type:complete len:199 (+) Transcript_86873:57-653(+)